MTRSTPDAADVATCAAACDAREACLAFVFDAAAADAGARCTLKQGVPSNGASCAVRQVGARLNAWA